jgi:hypothetical protein
VNGMLPCMDAMMDTSGLPLTGTADGGSTTQLEDTGMAGDGDDYYNGCLIYFTSGTLAGKSALVTDYTSVGGVFVLAPALPTAVTTHTYVILKGGVRNANATHWINSAIGSGLMDAAGVRSALGLATDNLDERTLDPDAAETLNVMHGDIITVDDATFSPTTTAFETSRTDDANELYDNQMIYWRSGTNTGITSEIAGYAFANSKVKLTVADALRGAPSDGDEFIVIARS